MVRADGGRPIIHLGCFHLGHRILFGLGSTNSWVCRCSCQPWVPLPRFERAWWAGKWRAVPTHPHETNWRGSKRAAGFRSSQSIGYSCRQEKPAGAFVCQTTRNSKLHADAISPDCTPSLLLAYTAKLKPSLAARARLGVLVLVFLKTATNPLVPSADPQPPRSQEHPITSGPATHQRDHLLHP